MRDLQPGEAARQRGVLSQQPNNSATAGFGKQAASTGQRLGGAGPACTAAGGSSSIARQGPRAQLPLPRCCRHPAMPVACAAPELVVQGCRLIRILLPLPLLLRLEGLALGDDLLHHLVRARWQSGKMRPTARLSARSALVGCWAHSALAQNDAPHAKPQPHPAPRLTSFLLFLCGCPPSSPSSPSSPPPPPAFLSNSPPPKWKSRLSSSSSRRSPSSSEPQPCGQQAAQQASQ